MATKRFKCHRQEGKPLLLASLGSVADLALIGLGESTSRVSSCCSQIGGREGAGHRDVKCRIFAICPSANQDIARWVGGSAIWDKVLKITVFFLIDTCAYTPGGIVVG